MEASYPGLVGKFLKEHSFRVKKGEAEGIVGELCLRMDALVFNVVSLVCIVARLHGKDRVEEAHLTGAHTYLRTSCHLGRRSKTPQAGGMTGMPGEFFGAAPDPAYQAAHAGAGTAAGAVDFAAGMARPEMGPSLGGVWDGAAGGASPLPAYLKTRAVKNHVRQVLHHHQMAMTAAATAGVLHLLHAHLECLAQDLAKHQPLTAAKAVRVAGLKRHAVFH